MAKFIVITIVIALLLLAVIVWRLISQLPPVAVVFLTGFLLALIGMMGLFIFVLTLVALFTPNPTYGQATPAPPTVHRTLIVFTHCTSVPGSAATQEHPYVLSHPHQPNPQSTALLPDRHRPYLLG